MWEAYRADTNRPFTLGERDYPCLIHGRPGSGASFFTVILAAALIRREIPVVFLCAKAEAVRALTAELGLGPPEVGADRVTARNEPELERHLLITFIKQNRTFLADSLRQLGDREDRVIVLKNIEEIMTPELWHLVKDQRHLIVSGDVDRITGPFPTTIWKTRLAFSPWQSAWGEARPFQTPSYVGTAWRQAERDGEVMVVEKD